MTKRILAFAAFATLALAACGGQDSSTPRTKNDALTSVSSAPALTRPSIETSGSPNQITSFDCAIRVENNTVTPCIGYAASSWSLRDARGWSMAQTPGITHIGNDLHERAVKIPSWSSARPAVTFGGYFVLENGLYASFEIPVGTAAPACPFTYQATVREHLGKTQTLSSLAGQIVVDKCTPTTTAESTTTTEPPTTTTTTTTTTTIAPTTTTSTSTTIARTTTTTTSTTSTTSTSTTIAPTTTAKPTVCVITVKGSILTACKKVTFTIYEWRAAGKRVGTPVATLSGTGWSTVNGVQTLNLANRTIPAGATSFVIQLGFVDGTVISKTEIPYGRAGTYTAFAFFE